MTSSSGPIDDPTFIPLCAVFRRYLKGQKLKFTPERAMILDAVLDKEGVFEAEQLFDEVQSAGHRVSKATIYRTLKHLQDAGIISEELIDSKLAHYRLSFGRQSRGMLACVETKRIVEFNAEQLEPFMREVCEKYGFEPVSFRFVVYGVSPDAKGQPQAEKSPHDSSA